MSWSAFQLGMSATALGAVLLPTVAQAQPSGSGQDDFAILAIIVILAIIGYLIPSIVAFWRRHPNRWLILILNTALGGTGIVWLGCLVWAFKALHLTDDPTGTNGGESGLNLAANDAVRCPYGPP